MLNYFSEVIWFCMYKLYNCLNVKEFNSPNKIMLLSENTDHLFHCTDDFSFFIRKYKFFFSSVGYIFPPWFSHFKIF